MEQDKADKLAEEKRAAITRKMTMAAGALGSKCDADNARVEAKMRMVQVNHQVSAERSRLA
eukprot:SAG22_NODE_1182_length_5233_cov_12.254188_4_plen_61_part_00